MTSRNKSVKPFMSLLLALFVTVLLIPSKSYASDYAFNPSGTPENLEDYSSEFVKQTAYNLGCSGGEAQTYNNALYFSTSCAQYKTVTFQNNFSFHVTGHSDPLSATSIMATWTNSSTYPVSVLAEGNFIASTASTSASFTPEIVCSGCSTGSYDTSGTPITLFYPFDVTFAYNGNSVAIYVNDAVMEQLPVDSGINVDSNISGRNIVIDGMSADTNGAVQTAYIACTPLDIQCNLYNFKTWLISLVVPDFSSVQSNYGTLSDTIKGKIPFAYAVAAFNLDFSGVATESAVPDLTMKFASTPAVVTSQFSIPSYSIPDATGHDDGRIKNTVLNPLRLMFQIGLLIMLVVFFWGVWEDFV